MADKTTALKILVETEAQRALKDFGELDKSVDKLAQSATSLNDDLGATESASERAAREVASLGDETGKTSDAVKDFAIIGGRSIAAIQDEADQARAAFKRLESSGEHSLEEIARAGELLDKRLEELEKEIRDVDKAAGNIDGAGFADLLSQIGAVAAATVSLQQAIVAVGDYAGFEDDLLAVKALASASTDEFQRLKVAAFDLAGAAGGPKAIAAAMGELAASGADVDEILSSVDIVGKLSGASRGALNFKASGDLLTNTIKQLRLGMDASLPVADRLAKGWNSAGHDGAELGDALTQVLPVVTELYGHLGDIVPLEKSIAVINVLAETYKKGSEGGNAYLMMLRALAKPVGEGAAALEKYKDKVQIFDDTGRIRDFADIIDDLRAAQISTTDQLAIFGEAWPGVTALIGAGGDAIRDMEAKLKDADGTVQGTSDTLQSGLGGAVREATAEFEKARLAAVEDFLPALDGILSLAQYADNAVAGLSGTIKTGAAVWSTAAGGVTRYLSYIEKLTDYIGVTDDATNSLHETSDAFLGSARDLGNQAASSFRKAKGEIDPLAESQALLASTSAGLKQTFANISRETGVLVTSMEEVDAAIASGAIRQDEATGEWIGSEREKQEAIADTARAAEQAAKDTANAEAKSRKIAKKEWEDWGKLVKDLLGDIVDREKELAGQLREMERSGMSAAEAQKALKEDAKAAAEEAKKLADEAERLQAAGESELAQEVFKQALEAADASNQAWEKTAGAVSKANNELQRSKKELKEARKEYKELKKEAQKDGIIDEKEKKKLQDAKKEIKELKKEVKENGKALVEEKKALEEAMSGVEEAGQLGIDILKQQKAAAEDNRESIDNAFNFSEAEASVQKLIDEHVAKVGPALAEGVKDGVDAAVSDAKRLEDALDAAAKDRSATMIINEVQGAFSGGQIWGTNMSAGARVSGPTGHDSVRAILAGNEWVINNKATGDIGHGHFYLENSRQWDKALLSLASYHGKDKTREILSGYLATDIAMPKATPQIPYSPGPGHGGQQLPNLGTIIIQNDQTGEKFPVYAKPGDAAKVARVIQQNANDKWHGSGRKGPKPGGI